MVSCTEGLRLLHGIIQAQLRLLHEVPGQLPKRLVQSNSWTVTSVTKFQRCNLARLSSSASTNLERYS